MRDAIMAKLLRGDVYRALHIYIQEAREVVKHTLHYCNTHTQLLCPLPRRFRLVATEHTFLACHLYTTLPLPCVPLSRSLLVIAHNQRRQP